MSDDDISPDAPRARKITLAPAENNVCVCFRVPLSKLAKHVRLTDPKYASQLSECFGAGTGCGWCIPFLERIFEQMKENPGVTPDIGLDYDEYLARRRDYHKRIDATKMKDTDGDLRAIERQKENPPGSEEPGG